VPTKINMDEARKQVIRIGLRAAAFEDSMFILGVLDSSERELDLLETTVSEMEKEIDELSEKVAQLEVVANLIAPQYVKDVLGES
jgi:hypothetical protein